MTAFGRFRLENHLRLPALREAVVGGRGGGGPDRPLTPTKTPALLAYRSFFALLGNVTTWISETSYTVSFILVILAIAGGMIGRHSLAALACAAIVVLNLVGLAGDITSLVWLSFRKNPLRGALMAARGAVAGPVGPARSARRSPGHSRRQAVSETHPCAQRTTIHPADQAPPSPRMATRSTSTCRWTTRPCRLPRAGPRPLAEALGACRCATDWDEDRVRAWWLEKAAARA